MQKKDILNDFLKLINLDIDPNEFRKQKKRLAEEIKSKEEFNKELIFHQALSNNTRLLIYKLLVNEPLCTCAIAEILGLSKGTITHHLKLLEKANLIIGRKKGYFTIYYTREHLLKEYK
ncbi:MAG: ArsR/SmtB family transcription factor [Promethearchaeota archaeon]